MANILVVEDEPALLELLSSIISEMNHKVTQANNGKKALEVLAREKPHLIISDIMMPFMDGYQLLSEIKQRPEWSNIKVVLISASPINHSRLPHPDAYASKPYDLEIIEAVVKRFTNLAF
ncbi:MAG TPA: response regulator [Chloroflexia bacterium]|nr:response regulator [Chloroflexia bacterium]